MSRGGEVTSLLGFLQQKQEGLTSLVEESVLFPLSAAQSLTGEGPTPLTQTGRQWNGRLDLAVIPATAVEAEWQIWL